jgi:ubiquinone/menaquinone biosynthesis C-methylase UbiE
MEKETYWSRFAEDFEERNNYVAGVENINAIRDTLRACAVKGDVLDLGCGNGTYSTVLAETATRVWATDYSEEMVAVSKDRLKSYETIEVEQANCLDLLYEDGQFDAVVMVNLLHVIPEPQQAIRESCRVLKTGGALIVVSFTAEGLMPEDLQKMFERYLERYGQPPECGRSLTVEDAKALVKTAGFQIREAHLIGTTCKAVFLHATRQ